MRRISTILLVTCTCFAVAAWAQSPGQPSATVNPSMVLYDDFNGVKIDPLKWSDASQTYWVREMVRELSPAYQGQGNNRRLHMFDRAYSDNFNNSGGNYGWLALQFTRPASVREVSFTFVINTATSSNCQSNPDFESSTWGGFVGRFFNYGGSTDPLQDVHAAIELYPASKAAGPFYAVASLNSQDGIVQQSEVLGTVSLGQTVKLRVKWDQANRQFIFQLNKDPAVSIGYWVMDTSAPVYTNKELWVGHGTPECASAPLGSATIDAYFDDVYVNAP